VKDLAAKIGVKAAYEALNLPRSRAYQQSKVTQQGREKPSHALAQSERAAVRALLNSERFMDKAPRQVYAALLDEGSYLCHWRTMYRILSEHGEVHERRILRQHPSYKKPELLATAPNQVWSWDITTLRGPSKWSHYKLYTVLDIFSRCVVGWMIAEVESSDLAKQLVAASAEKQAIVPEQLVLHADNGAPMTGKALSQLLISLGIEQSHSRPHTSNDNPFSEAQFKTMKYRPDYPERFESIQAARTWAEEFFTWYNEEHYHTGLNLFTPSSVHYGEVLALQAQRQAVLAQAFTAHPQRFPQGKPQVKGAPTEVYINPPKAATNLS
jgi:putative transposase